MNGDIARYADIAWRHGFTDEKYFYRIFKAEFGHTPRETVEQFRQRRETGAH